MILLTDEEIAEAWTDDVKYCDLEKELKHKARQVAKAQLKKVVEWGKEVCTDNAHHRDYDCMWRHCCLDCWQALVKEVEG